MAVPLNVASGGYAGPSGNQFIDIAMVSVQLSRCSVGSMTSCRWSFQC